MTLAEVFRDADVARAYRHRAPYPAETFDILTRLLVEPRTVLDVGAGSGALARTLARSVARVDALDPSSAMVDEGRRLPGGDHERLRWIVGRAEDAALDPPYGLVTAGSSLHWMDADRVMPRFAEALAPGGRLAALDTQIEAPWRTEVVEVFKRYSELDHHVEFPERMAELEARGLFVPEGELQTAPVPWRQSVDDYLEALHSTSTLARVRLGSRTAAFDQDIRGFFRSAGHDGLRSHVVATVVWGRPQSPRR